MESNEFIKVNEKWREYTFSNGQTIHIDGILSIRVSRSGYHRINSVDGLKYIIPPTWVQVKFDAEKWTF